MCKLCGTSGTYSETRCGNSRRYNTTNVALQIGLAINVSRTKIVIDRKEKRNEPEESGTNGQGRNCRNVGVSRLLGNKLKYV
jgi:hypothetical protein